MKERILFLSPFNHDARRAFENCCSKYKEQGVEFVARINERKIETDFAVIYYRGSEEPDRLRGNRFHKIILDERVPTTPELRHLILRAEEEAKWLKDPKRNSKTK